MSAIAGIPIQVDPEASARVAELGMQKEFQFMLDHAQQVIPKLQEIHVTLNPPYDTGDEPRIVIEALRNGPYSDDDPTQRQLIEWEVKNLIPDVLRHFCMMVTYRTTDAR